MNLGKKKKEVEKEMATHPVFLPGESQGQGSLVGYRLWGRPVGHNGSDLAAAAARKKKKRRDTKRRLFLPLPPSPSLFPPAESPRKDRVSTH